MSLEEWKDKRKEWTTARDKKFKIAQGAVKGVKLGESIEAVHKASLKNLMTLHTATKKLLDDLKTYKAKMEAKHPEAVKWLSENVKKPAKEIFEAGDDMKYWLYIQGSLSGAVSKIPNFPAGEEFRKVADNAERVGMTWKAAANLSLFPRLEKSVGLWKTVAKEVRGAAKKIKLKLPGKTTAVAMEVIADNIDHEADLVQALVNTCTFRNFL
jgi:hypothetical protein